MISKSPERYQFSTLRYKNLLVEDPDNENAKEMIDLYNQYAQDQAMKEEEKEWQENNMEYDLRTTDWILEKVRGDNVYAQHLYAAMCNNTFQKLDTWPILKDEQWSCSWRHAGGVVADMQQKGDYIDWYCSGIRNGEDVTDEEFFQFTKEQQESYIETKNYISEGVVTDEIQQDLEKLGWAVLTEKE